MVHKKLRGAVLIGIIGGMELSYLLGLTLDGFYAQPQISFLSPFTAFEEFTSQSLFQVFASGFDVSAYASTLSSANLVLMR